MVDHDVMSTIIMSRMKKCNRIAWAHKQFKQFIFVFEHERQNNTIPKTHFSPNVRWWFVFIRINFRFFRFAWNDSRFANTWCWFFFQATRNSQIFKSQTAAIDDWLSTGIHLVRQDSVRTNRSSDGVVLAAAIELLEKNECAAIAALAQRSDDK